LGFAAEEKPYVFGVEEILRPYAPDVESGTAQALLDIRSVAAEVVMLTKHPQTPGGVCNGGIFESLLGGYRHHDDCMAAGPEHAIELAHRLEVVGHMLQNMAAMNYVERVVGILNVADIRRYLS